MEKTNKFFWLILKVLLILSMLALTWIVYDKLPAQMPIHWNFSWQPDNFWPKERAILLLPWISIVMIILFYFLSSIDPRKEKYNKFAREWEIIQVIILSFFTYIYAVMIYITLNPEKSITSFMLLGLWIMFTLLWNYMWKLRSNYFIWIKTPWTLDNEQVWNKTHRLWWIVFVLWWLSFILLAFFQLYIAWIFWVVIWTMIILPIAYSYFVYKSLK